MKLSIIIPTTGNHPEFVEQARKMIDRQTILKSMILEVCEIIQAPGPNGPPTIAQNLQRGYNNAKGDLVVFWEHDDYYDPEYLETMLNEWEPGMDIIGTDNTIYYHLGLCEWRLNKQHFHSSMMNTIIRAGIEDLPFAPLDDPFVDIRIWSLVKNRKLRGKRISDRASIGIKHGIGRTGGRGHSVEFPYKEKDHEMTWLKSQTDPESFEFYCRIHDRIK